MNVHEAIQVLSVINQADGGCYYCFVNLLTGLRKQLPDAPWREALFAWPEADYSYDSRERLWEETAP